MLGRCRTLSRHRDGPETDPKSTSAYLSRQVSSTLVLLNLHCLCTEKTKPLSLTKHELKKWFQQSTMHVHRKTTDGQHLDDTFNF